MRAASEPSSTALSREPIRYLTDPLQRFLLVGTWIWFEFHESGIHATVAGVIIGLLTPTRVMVKRHRLNFTIHRTLHFMQGERWEHPAERYAAMRQMERMARESLSPLERLETELHPWVGFVIMPLFAFANAVVGMSLIVLLRRKAPPADSCPLTEGLDAD